MKIVEITLGKYCLSITYVVVHSNLAQNNIQKTHITLIARVNHSSGFSSLHVSILDLNI